MPISIILFSQPPVRRWT